MLPTYALIGASIKVLGGRVPVLTGFLFGFAFLGELAGWFVLSGELAAVQNLGWSTKIAISAILGLILTRLAGTFLFKPWPQDRFPANTRHKTEEGLAIAILTSLPMREGLGGFHRYSIFARKEG